MIGRTLAAASMILTLAAVCHAASNPAVDIKTAYGESDLYVLYKDGTIMTVGTAVNYGQTSNVDVIEMELTPSRNGYYVLDAEGHVHTFGDALPIGEPVLGRTEKIVDMEVTSDLTGMYFLTQEGKIYTAGEAVFRGEFVMDGAVDFELTTDSQGYYVLYDDGEIAFFGDASDSGTLTSSKQKAVDLQVVNGGYYVLYSDGAIQPFGQATSLPPVSGLQSPAVSFSFTSQGYRVVDQSGTVFSVIRPELQSLTQSISGAGGFSTWYAQTGAAPAQTTPTPKPGDPFFTIGGTSFKQKVIAKLPLDSTVPDFMTTGQVSLPKGGVILVTGVSDGPARRLRYFAADAAVGAGYSGVLFAELTSGRGAAEIRGISYSDKGLNVLVSDYDGLYLLLIEGVFESSGITGFQNL
ncbi:MAG: hypothetical protein GC154_09760 [bacterium]|nr:hypothetical protein [bacterium]